MAASESVVSPPAPPVVELRSGMRTPRRLASPTVSAVVAMTVVGAVLRVIVAHQSVFADELSTYWISTTHSFGGVLSLLYGSGPIKHAEITPPLSFLASWLSTRLGATAELLRAPELLAGTATIPLIYAVGRRSVRPCAALLAAAVTALSPFMIYYSAEARAYGLMMFLVLCATLSMLLALDTGRARYWVLYGVFSAAAFYTHYTSAFVLAAALVWLLWSEPAARRPALLANIGAALLVVPWIPGLIADLDSPTITILSALSPFTASAVKVDLEHWALGYPYAVAGGLQILPGVAALVLLGVVAILSAGGLLVAAGRVGWRSPVRAVHRVVGRESPDRRIRLLAAMMVATPVGESIGSAVGTHIIGVRDLGASWPFLALCAAALVTAGGRRLGAVAAALTVIAFALGALKMFDSRFERPAYQAAADYVAQHAAGRDAVVDITPTPGPLTGLDVTLHRRIPVFRAVQPAERDHPFGVFDAIVPLDVGVGQAVAAARGGRVFVVTAAGPGRSYRSQVHDITAAFPPGYRLVTLRVWERLEQILVAVYAVPHVNPR